ncbi:MAG: glycoside hydrolase family 16 protein, partial [Bacteroidota bacterium]
LEEFRAEFFFIFNIAVGGNLPGNPNSSTQFPQQMIVDYVRVFQEN